ncbi:BrnA antitoxin family protein [Sphingomonas sp. CFBP 13733]|nr:BrnA antitoxin family protein [Sphingomonas sp. CFBP 13733]
MRVDPDVLATFREGGPGWQGRINAPMRAAAGLQG